MRAQLVPKESAEPALAEQQETGEVLGARQPHPP